MSADSDAQSRRLIADDACGRLRSRCSWCWRCWLFWLDPDNFYLWVKAVHVIAVISWMAGMLYLPRLFVYHAECRAGLAAVGNLQGHGAAAAARDHQSGDDRHLGVRPVARLEGFWLQGGWLHAKIAPGRC